MENRFIKIFSGLERNYGYCNVKNGYTDPETGKLKFKPGDYFNKWHSEHCGDYATRVMVFQLYLSDHNCGTEFFSGETIESEAGKAVLFPPYFTHTHRGQPCPQNKIRYLITGYYNFISLT